MSQENVELVRKAIDAWNSDGVEALLEFYTEDVVWYPFPDSPDSVSGFNGHYGIREVMRGFTDSFEEYTVTAGEVRDHGDKVVGLGEISGASGDPMCRFANRWDTSGGTSGAERSARPASFPPGEKPSKPWGCRSKRPRLEAPSLGCRERR